MEYDIVYIVMCEGEVVYASVDRESAEGYAYDQTCKAIQEVLDEWGNDDPTEDDIDDAELQSGQDGVCYESHEIDLSSKTEDDIIELPDGSEIEVFEILEKLRTSE